MPFPFWKFPAMISSLSQSLIGFFLEEETQDKWVGRLLRLFSFKLENLGQVFLKPQNFFFKFSHFCGNSFPFFFLLQNKRKREKVTKYLDFFRYTSFTLSKFSALAQYIEDVTFIGKNIK